MKKFAKMSLMAIVMFTVASAFVGCTPKVVEVPKYIYNEAPVLETKVPETAYSFGKLYNRNGKVCVKKWEGCAEYDSKAGKCLRHYSNCIPKKDFLNLVEYMQDLGGTITKHNGQVTTYNDWAKIQNEKAVKSKAK